MADQPKRKTIPAKNSVETIVRAPKKGDRPIAKQDPIVRGSTSSMSNHIMAGIGGAIVGGIIVSTGELMRL
jgi:hypothetical protein